MNETDCARLVNLLTSTWPNGVRGHVWSDTLGPLVFSTAHAAYVELRAGEERPPSIARFLGAYHAHRLAGEQADELDGGQAPRRCELCDDAGWAESPPERAHHPSICNPTEERPCRCHAVEPCRCSRGRRQVDVTARIHDYNDRTKRALEPVAAPPPRPARPIEETLPL